MRQVSENFMTMAEATLKMLQTNETVWSGNAPFAALVNAVKEGIDAVTVLQKDGNAVSTGATLDKELAGDAAIAQAMRLSKFAQVYLLEKGNHTLHDQVKVSRSSMDRHGDAELTAALQNLHEKLSSLSTEAESYGITAAELNKLKDLTKTFDDIKSNPRMIVSGRKSSNMNIPATLRHLREIFHKTDRLIHLWDESHPQFFNNYNNARIIIDLGVRHEKKEKA